MKKIYFVCLFSILSLGLFSQVQRQKVIVEIGTGTWCTYCPGAAMGAEDLVANGCQVGNIEYHNGDDFTNDASNARNSYYGITGYPTAHFDGVLEFVGGSHTESMYPNYLPLYNQRYAIPSDFTIDIYGQNTGSVYDIELVLTKVSGTWGDLTCQLVLTESDIVYSWQGQDHLSYVERLMAPDYEGTTVNFDDVDEITLDLQFTMDADWVADNCELVAFLQNEATKEVLQGNMVAIPNLQPMQATAGFGCTDNTPCITTSVEFEDESMGEIISWNWSFEGGTPATSTDENPVIAYNSLGQYDVQLIVYDGTVYDTLLNPNYILVIDTPAQPVTPTGATDVCQDDGTAAYLTSSVQWAINYIWAVDPPAAGTIVSGDTNTVLTLDPTYLGDYTVKVRADNSCGEGTWSDVLTATVHLTPTDYTLSEGGGYCEGGAGYDVSLDGSDQGVTYELLLDGESTGQTMQGTGSAIDFGNQTEEGIYTCLAYTDYCDNNMIGNSYIYVIHAPVQAGTPSGATTVCGNDSGVSYTTSGATGATTYSWTINPSEAGVITGTTTTATVDWSADFSGTAAIHVVGVNSCFTGPPSDDLNVTVNAVPQPEISGDQQVCDGDVGVIYTTIAVEGDTYTWEVGGGTIASGAGTNEITVNWGNPGNGFVRVTETSASECSFTTNDYNIVIDDCTGIGEGDADAFNIYPNPVKNELIIHFASQTAGERVVIANQIGQVVYDQLTDGKQQLIINTSSFSNGIYAVKVYSENSVSEKKVVKVD